MAQSNYEVYANEVQCGGNVRATGAARCPIDFKELDRMLLVPVDDYLTSADLLALPTTIVDKLNDPDPALRWHVVGKFLNVEDKSTDIQINEVGYGGAEIGSAPKYHWYFTHDGKLSGHKVFTTFRGKHTEYSAFFLDPKMFDNGVMHGVRRSDGGLSPYPLSLLYTGMFGAGGTESSKAGIGVALKNSEDFERNSGFARLPSNFAYSTTLQGLEYAELQQVSATLSSVGVVTLKLMGDTTNLYSRVSTGIAAAIKAYNVSTGAAITITSTTLNAVSENFVVDIDSSDTDWPASAGGLVKISASMTDLIAQSIVGISDFEITIARA
jgi:hypothetical protein